MQNPLRITKTDLDGRRWTTPEQTAWLEMQIPAFTSAQSNPLQVRTAFQVKVYQDWVARWPVEAAPPSLDPQADATEVSAAAKEHVNTVCILKVVRAYCCSVTSKLITFWLQCLKQWFNNHARGIAAAVGSEHQPKLLNLSVQPTRKLSATHTYSKLYYVSKLKPIVDKAWEQHVAENPVESQKKGKWLRHQNKLLAKLLSDKTEEVKPKVEHCCEEGVAPEADDNTPEAKGTGESTSIKEKQRHTKAYAFQKYMLSSACNDAS